MKFIPKTHIPGYNELPVLELTRRNLETLLEKLDDPMSQRTLVDEAQAIGVRAVENREHYSDRPSGITYTKGKISGGAIES